MSNHHLKFLLTVVLGYAVGSVLGLILAVQLADWLYPI